MDDGVVGAQSIVKPGVCTSSTRPASPFEGQMIYETDTDKVLVYSGSAWLYSLTPQTLEAGAWQTWTPTITASTGSFTTITVSIARYSQIKNLVTVMLEFGVTSIGTASGVPLSNLPVVARAGNSMALGSYRETAVNGLSGVISWNNTNSVVFHRYDNASHLTAGAFYGGTFMYEAA